MDLVLPRWLDGEDVSIGAFLRHRLGAAMVDRLADPLLGGIYGAPVDDLSLFAVVPQLRDYERDHRSLLFASLAQGRAARRRVRAAAASATGRPAAPVPQPGRVVGRLRLVPQPRRREQPRRRARGRRSRRPGPRPGTSVTLQRMGARTAVTLSDGMRLTPDAVILAGTADRRPAAGEPVLRPRSGRSTARPAS
jgi:oxygen-dependent protoporphyrinogen oxidase